jgi:Leucine-rich repeat (LRR) protein
MSAVNGSFAHGRVLHTVVATLLLTVFHTAGKPRLLRADDQRIHGRRGTLEVHQVDRDSQIVEWIGPGAVQLAWPRLEWKYTIISLRVVPTGLPQVGAFAAMAPTYGLSLCGVALADEDLDFIVKSCPELQQLWLCHPSTMSQDEFSDLTDDERAVFATRTLSGACLAKIGELEDLTALEIGGYALPPTRLQFLANLKQLRVLDLHDTKITDEDLRSLCNLQHLTTLNLSGTPVTGRGLRYLRNCHSLEYVILDRTSVTDEMAKCLADNPPPSLNRLGIHGCKLTSHGMAALERAVPLFTVVETSEYVFASVTPPEPRTAQAIRLYRAACGLLWNLGVAGFQTDGKKVNGIGIVSDRHWSGAWTSSLIPRFKGLNSLSLAGCKLSAEALEQLRQQDELEYLDLSNSSIDDTALAPLADLQCLKWLDLSHTKVTDAGLWSLSGLAHLEHLELSATKVTDRGVRALRALPRLNSLGLESCQITDEAAQALADIAELAYLDLDHTRVTDRSLATLVKLPRLKWLNLVGCQVTDAGAARLLESPMLETFRLEGTAVSADLKTKLGKHVSGAKPKPQPGNDSIRPNNGRFRLFFEEMQ